MLPGHGTAGGGAMEFSAPAELRERFPQPNVVIEDSINYDDLFAHADVLFVTTGGFGGVLSAMSHGVPVVTAGTR